MQNLEHRITALESVKPWREFDGRGASDADLLAFLGWPPGYVPKDEELQTLVNDGAKNDRND